MGNTNIPQAGAADEKNGRETLSGMDQLTDEQKKAALKKGAQRSVEGDTEIPDGTDHSDEATVRRMDGGSSSSDAG